ncbi:MAG: choice-of-anchor X domain-containing protein, partial [Thermoplasmata archaeon]
MKKRTIVIVLIMFTSVLNLGIMTSNASNIEAIDINPSKEIDGKTITSGLTNISVIDQGDSNRSELWIDGELYAYMDEADDPYHWTYQIDTRGFNDGSHKIQVRSIGGTGGNDIKSKQVWFDNSEPKLKNKSISYPANYNAAKDNSTIYVKAEFEDSISGLDSVSLNPEPLNGTNKEMFDDGKHDDGAANDGLYSSEKFKVFGETSYSYFNISVKDRIGNNHTYNIEVKMDNIKPTIRNMQVDQPIGQESVKEGDKIRVTGDARDLGLKYSEVSAPSNVDSVLIVDNSASMTEGDMNDAKEAAKTFVETLSPEDRCALYTFEEDGSNPVRKVDYLNMTEENKKIINSTIEELNATASATPIWDSIGEATSYAWNNQKSNHVPSVVSMTDGEDTSSDSYVPGSRWSNFDGLANRTWNMTENHYWGEEKEYDWEVVRYRHPRDSFIWRANTIDSPNRWGLNKAPLPIYNIGLGVSPQASNSSAEGYLDPESTTSDEDCEYIGSHVQSSAYAYNFTQEYDLSTISDSSDGNYHYAPESSELSNIYENISKSIEKKGRKWIGQEAPHGFKNVYLDAHELGQKSMITMYDDGEHGDGKPNDGIYGTEMFDVKTQDTKNATVWMFGEDKAGNINGSYKFLDVDNRPPSIQEKNVNYPN